MPDLITLQYLQDTLAAGGVTLSADQLAAAPAAISAASDTVIRWCGGREFVRKTYTEVGTPERDGRIALRQFPVHTVSRLTAPVADALLIQNNSPTNQSARVLSTFTGTIAGGNVAATGLSLVRLTSGTATTVNVTYADNPTLNALADAIDALGFGWSASAGTYGDWPSTDLSWLDVTQDAKRGARLSLWADEIDPADVDNRTGLLWVGQDGGGLNSPRWGPDWPAWGSDPTRNRVRVTYDAGFDVVPAVVQQAVAETVKASYDRLATDATITREKMGRYEYETPGMKDFQAIPPAVMQALSTYRIVWA